MPPRPWTGSAVPHETRIVSAHRTPDRLREYATTARERGLRVIIAGAGGAAHLPGMCAAWTSLPVLGVPVESHALKGMDSLLSIVQMPAGVPVGTLAIGRAGAVNAGLLAAAILAHRRSRHWRRGWTHCARSRPAAVTRAEPARRRHDRFPLPPNATIGLVGGGQLGRMSALAAARLGYRCHILTREADSPAGQVVRRRDDQRLQRPGGAARLRRRGGRDQLRVRERQRRGAGPAGLAEAGAAGAGGAADQPGPGRGEEPSSTAPASPTAPWRAGGEPAPSCGCGGRELGLPAVLKTTRLGYDGKGQRTAARRGGPGGRLRRAGAEAADPRGVRRFRLRDQRGRSPAARTARCPPSTPWRTAIATISWT